MRFDLAQGSHQAVEQAGKRTRKAREKKKTDSISNKKRIYRERAMNAGKN